MFHIDLITVGKAPKGAIADLCATYQKRITWKLCVIDTQDPLKYLQKEAFIIALDERGDNMSSIAFASLLEKQASQRIHIVVGGPDGHEDSVRARTNVLLAFGAQTWPHRFVRVMALEQIYRAQQILLGHPYHRA